MVTAIQERSQDALFLGEVAFKQNKSCCEQHIESIGFQPRTQEPKFTHQGRREVGGFGASSIALHWRAWMVKGQFEQRWSVFELLPPELNMPVPSTLLHLGRLPLDKITILAGGAWVASARTTALGQTIIDC